MEFFFVKRTLSMVNLPSIDKLPIVLISREVKTLNCNRIFLVFGLNSFLVFTERDSHHESVQPRECCKLLHIVCGEARTVDNHEVAEWRYEMLF